VVDDLLVYLTAEGYRLVSNAATRQRLGAWLRQQAADFEVQLRERSDLAILAVQGPEARARLSAQVTLARAALIKELPPFQGLDEGGWFIARTGYTGEDGLEVMLPASEAADFFNELVGAGIAPIGLGARDTLRLEAGLCLYGQDMDESVSPLVSNLAWSIAWTPGREFIGRAALEAEREAGVSRKLVGLVLEERGVLRARQAVRVEDIGEGEVTSGSFAPTLGKSIALARLPMATGERAEVEIRGKWHPVRAVIPPFVLHGRILIWFETGDSPDNKRNRHEPYPRRSAICRHSRMGAPGKRRHRHRGHHRSCPGGPGRRGLCRTAGNRPHPAGWRTGRGGGVGQGGLGYLRAGQRRGGGGQWCPGRQPRAGQLRPLWQLVLPAASRRPRGAGQAAGCRRLRTGRRRLIHSWASSARASSRSLCRARSGRASRNCRNAASR